MKNKLLFLFMLASIICVLLLIPGSASAKTYGGEFDSATKDPNGNMYTLTWIYDDITTTLYLEGYGAIPEMKSSTLPWAKYQKNITKVVIEEGINQIGKLCFVDHKELREIVLSESVKSIVMRAFEGCSSIEEITIPGTVTNIGDMAFKNCTSLKKVVFEDGIKDIGCNMFQGCKSLEDVYVYGMDTYISRQRSNNIDGVWFRDCDFDKLTAHCLKGSDADKYFTTDIYKITNWSDKKGNEVTQSFAKQPNYMTQGGYTLNVEYIE